MAAFSRGQPENLDNSSCLGIPVIPHFSSLARLSEFSSLHGGRQRQRRRCRTPPGMVLSDLPGRMAWASLDSLITSLPFSEHTSVPGERQGPTGFQNNLMPHFEPLLPPVMVSNSTYPANILCPIWFFLKRGIFPVQLQGSVGLSGSIDICISQPR